MNRSLLSFLLVLVLSTGYAQNDPDTLGIETFIQDSILTQKYQKRFNPQRAILYAAIMPGLGQVYTKKYWKLPLVYGGFYGIGYGLNFYQKFYTKYKGHLYYNLENGLASETATNPDTGFTTGQLRTLIDRSRRERDYMIVFMGLMYILQMVDAHVDTHLKEFDLNPNLQVRLEPLLRQEELTGRQSGIALVFRF